MAATLLLLPGCMPDKEIRAMARQGGGSETTITGRVVDITGTPVPGAAVRMRLEDDLPLNLFSPDSGEVTDLPLAHTDQDGTFRLPGRASGSYFVECRSPANGAALLRAEIASQDTLRLPDAVLRPTGAVKGRIAAPMENGEVAPWFYSNYVFIPGLWKRDIASQENGFGFLLKDVPAGRYTLRVQPAFPSSLSWWKILEVPDVEVGSGDTLDLDSLSLPERTGLQDSAYTRDSLAIHSIYLANPDSNRGPDSGWVEAHTAVIGNRITMFVSFDTPLQCIPKEIRSLDALEVIYMLGLGDSNRLDVAPEVSSLPHLKRLWLVNFDLSRLPAWTGTFPELTSLELNRVDAFPEWVLELGRLSYLELGGDLLPIPETLDRLRSLHTLNLSGNELASFPRVLMGMPSLQGVNLRRNRLCSTTAEEKAWIAHQDSLWWAGADPLMYMPDTAGWESTQRCGP
jgi:hypothetical protein